MPVFIGLSLALCFLIETNNPLQTVLTSMPFVYIGLTGSILSIVAMFFKKLSDNIGYDAFSASTLLLWFAYWKPMPMFTADSPVFFYFPLYFALMAAFFILLLTNQSQQIDRETLQYMQRFDKERAMPAWALMLCVLGSLEVTQHYMLYPVLMTLLMLRFAFAKCVQDNPD
jgi:hypothetical protein